MWQMICPVNLAIFYPHPENQLVLWQVGLAALLLLAITVVVFRLRRTRPYLLVGWFWYIIMLLPVIGIVQVGLQAHADRYTHLPQIGLWVAIIWLTADWAAAFLARRRLVGAAAIGVTVLLGAITWRQVGFWKDSETLWRHALAVTHDNDVAEANLGMVLAEDGRVEEGIEHLQNALTIRSGPVLPHHTLTLALIHCDLGYALARKGWLDEAIAHLREAVALRPNYPDAHYNLASALAQQGRNREALAEYRRTLELRPADAEAHASFGDALVQAGLIAEAVAQYEAAVRLAPDSVLALNNLAWILSVSPDDRTRNGARAVPLAERAVRLSGRANAVFLRTLAAAYAENGRFLEAVDTVQQALQFAGAEENPAATRVLTQDLELYRAHTPLRDPSLGH
jgi:Flp pilus assembly protein TadD